MPGVGLQLMDHIAFPIMMTVSPSESLMRFAERPLLGIIKLLKYLATSQGLMGWPMTYAALFACSVLIDDQQVVRTERTQDKDNTLMDARPDIEVMLLEKKQRQIKLS
ncbi:hypothetical protein H2203_000080 [Taxawa tesnikishii (nom. ined.)]|nr:hypothetical protein H2203_000080 [Dothideales sp. JES 119]